MSGPRPLTDVERIRFARIADVLIPNALGMPSASEVGSHEAPLDRVLALRPEVFSAVERGLAALTTVDDDPVAAAEALNSSDPEALGTIGLAASSAYYMTDEVRRRLGYPGQVSRPVTASEEFDFLEDGLLDAVVRRGPIYRPTVRRDGGV